MPMNPGDLKAKMKQRIYNGLQTQFGSAAGQSSGYPEIASQNWEKLAEAISGIAMDIVTEITTNAQVDPGIPIIPVSGPTAAPGKIS